MKEEKKKGEKKRGGKKEEGKPQYLLRIWTNKLVLYLKIK